ncbi:copper transporter 5 [Capsicum annuum]|uniref:copper transporter 5 n=1 Tax=Capsicum annuum TaxID=4072 RepID=UPI0007BEE40E|nr:copper transporter 5 [Capsicum annuum]
MMHMTFYWGKKVTLLFDFWRTDSWTSYAIALLACFIFSLFYQYMEDRRQRFRILSINSKRNYSQPPPPPPPAVNAPLLYTFPSVGGKWSSARFATAILFGVNSAIGYMLMLAVMSFNGGVFIAVVVGLGIGYLFFRNGDENDVVVDNPCACA